MGLDGLDQINLKNLERWVCSKCFKLPNCKENNINLNKIMKMKKIIIEKKLTPLIENIRETIKRSYAKVVRNNKQKNE